MSSPVVVVGAGAAGLMAAIFAAERGAETFLLERTADGGRKILISGGGRCNVLPSVLAPDRFVTDSPPHVMRGMLKAWPLAEQRAFFEGDLGVALALEEDSGKLFSQIRSRPGYSRWAGAVRTRSGRPHDVWHEPHRSRAGRQRMDAGHLERRDARRTRRPRHRRTFGAEVTGSDGTGLRIASSLGHREVPTYPALTPLTADSGGRPPHASLAGVSLPVRLRARAETRTIETNGGFLFTHRGYSGPSVLDISHIATRQGERAAIRAQWSSLTEAEWRRDLDARAALVASILGRYLPARLTDQLMKEAGVPNDRRTSDLRRTERTALLERLTSYELPWTGDEGYKKAEVTGGGVALDEVNPRTLESRRRPGLYLCGEMLDAFGPIGGHNFAWAWATGRSAGLAAGAIR